jgi:hypothetical protein
MSWMPPGWEGSVPVGRAFDFELEGEGVVVVGRGAVGKALWRAFSRARVLAWKRGPDWVYPDIEIRTCKFIRGKRVIEG